MRTTTSLDTRIFHLQNAQGRNGGKLGNYSDPQCGNIRARRARMSGNFSRRRRRHGCGCGVRRDRMTLHQATCPNAVVAARCGPSCPANAPAWSILNSRVLRGLLRLAQSPSRDDRHVASGSEDGVARVVWNRQLSRRPWPPPDHAAEIARRSPWPSCRRRAGAREERSCNAPASQFSIWSAGDGRLGYFAVLWTPTASPASCRRSSRPGARSLAITSATSATRGPTTSSGELLQETDILFISAFTRAAQTAYAISNLYRRRGAVTVLGGPHARCYPAGCGAVFRLCAGPDRQGHRSRRCWRDGAPHRPLGRQLGANAPAGRRCRAWRSAGGSSSRPSPRRRLFSVVPMIGSMGCPYTCSFCIDSVVDYQPLPFEQIPEDLRFLLTKRAPPARRLARSEFRRSLRRLHGGDRASGAARADPVHRREQPLAALRAASPAAAAQRLRRPPARHRILVRPRQQVQDRPQSRGSTRSARSPITST